MTSSYRLPWQPASSGEGQLSVAEQVCVCPPPAEYDLWPLTGRRFCRGVICFPPLDSRWWVHIASLCTCTDPPQPDSWPVWCVMCEGMLRGDHEVSVLATDCLVDAHTSVFGRSDRACSTTGTRLKACTTVLFLCWGILTGRLWLNVPFRVLSSLVYGVKLRKMNSKFCKTRYAHFCPVMQKEGCSWLLVCSCFDKLYWAISSESAFIDLQESWEE